MPLIIAFLIDTAPIRGRNKGLDMEDRKGKFWTVRGFFYHARVLGENETHFSIEDISSGKKLELLKTVVERIEWEGA